MGFLLAQVDRKWPVTMRYCQGDSEWHQETVTSKCHSEEEQLPKGKIRSQSLMGLVVRFLSPRSICLSTPCPSVCPKSKKYLNQYKATQLCWLVIWLSLVLPPTWLASLIRTSTGRWTLEFEELLQFFFFLRQLELGRSLRIENEAYFLVPVPHWEFLPRWIYKSPAQNEHFMVTSTLPSQRYQSALPRARLRQNKAASHFPFQRFALPWAICSHSLPYWALGVQTESKIPAPTGFTS